MIPAPLEYETTVKWDIRFSRRRVNFYQTPRLNDLEDCQQCRGSRRRMENKCIGERYLRNERECYVTKAEAMCVRCWTLALLKLSPVPCFWFVRCCVIVRFIVHCILWVSCSHRQLTLTVHSCFMLSLLSVFTVVRILKRDNSRNETSALMSVHTPQFVRSKAKQTSRLWCCFI
jgi:hypothetical protein